MIVKTRNTAQGTEYWDNVEKRVRFVPAGKDPDFEVTTEYKSMLPGKEEPINQDDIMNFSDMTLKELKQFAVENKIEIPAEITKKDDIIAFLTEDDN
ncbi:hypothetical protein [Heyndrickxia acidiproducens]|uniref:hypothetical protein n=1 Tax=Heyndrickxia acidiproducens TaxID=1121084 RepID=UPI0003609D45|nr:hypothetical protein [Heyndrickxia acidiproducens]